MSRITKIVYYYDNGEVIVNEPNDGGKYTLIKGIDQHAFKIGDLIRIKDQIGSGRQGRIVRINLESETPIYIIQDGQFLWGVSGQWLELVPPPVVPWFATVVYPDLREAGQFPRGPIYKGKADPSNGLSSV